METTGRILAVDDESIVLESVKRLAEDQGFTVDTVRSAREALTLLQGAAYALVITDLMMPGMNGIDFVKAARAAGASVPVVMITGYPTIRTAVESLRVGAADYITKPFTRQELMQAIRRALTLGTAELSADQAARGYPRPGPAGGERPAVVPGALFALPGHAWAEYGQDGTVTLGIDRALLRRRREVTALTLPEEGELLEQGYPMATVALSGEEPYTVFSPLTGQVIEVNPAAREAPGSVDAGTWLVRIIPSAIHEELERLAVYER